MVKKGRGRPNLLGEDARRVTFDFPARDYEALDSIAVGEGVSMATIIRWAIEAYTKDHVATAVAAHARHEIADNVAALALHQFVEKRAKKK